MFRLEYGTQPRKFLKNLDKNILNRILTRLENLEKEPIPSDSKFSERKSSVIE